MALTLSHFKNLFKTYHNYSFLCQSPPPQGAHISYNLSHLENIPIDEEIILSINSFKPYKAPGLDGLHPFYYQKYWDTVGPSVTTLCRKVFKNGIMPDQINETHICLIPKKKEAKELRDFRPISLCNTTYKIITKILISSLKNMINQIIGPCQVSFLENRSRGQCDNSSRNNIAL